MDALYGGVRDPIREVPVYALKIFKRGDLHTVGMGKQSCGRHGRIDRGFSSYAVLGSRWVDEFHESSPLTFPCSFRRASRLADGGDD